MKQRLIIATRASRLALWQTNWVRQQIRQRHPSVLIELIELKTKGDKILDTPLAQIGGKGLFVKELETALLTGQADIAVHSLKDVPTEQPTGLEISVIARREHPSDAFVSNRFQELAALPAKAVVGTSSLRRIAQLKHQFPDLTFKSLRGNVLTRLQKLDRGEFDAIILAAAGLHRLDQPERITHLIPHAICLPAIGQGAICIESRQGDQATLDLINELNDTETEHLVSAERALLKRLNGGCQVPLAGHAVLTHQTITLTGMIAAPDGSRLLRMSESGPSQAGATIGERLGTRLISAGGGDILSAVGIDVD